MKYFTRKPDKSDMQHNLNAVRKLIIQTKGAFLETERQKEK